MFRALLWKEWRGLQVRAAWSLLGLGALMLLGGVGVGLMIVDGPADSGGSRGSNAGMPLLWAGMLGGWALLWLGVLFGNTAFPILMCMGLVARERRIGALKTLASLPAPAWKIYAAKTLVGVLAMEAAVVVAVVSLFLGLSVSAFIDHGQMLEALLVWQVLLILGATSVFYSLLLMLWLIVAGMRARNEAQAGVIGVTVLVSAGVIFWLGWHADLPAWLRSVMLWINPLGLISASASSGYAEVAEAVCGAAATAVVLWFWGLLRFRSLLRGNPRWWEGITFGGGEVWWRSKRLRAGLRTRTGALVWKEYRMLKWALLCIAAATLLAVVVRLCLDELAFAPSRRGSLNGYAWLELGIFWASLASVLVAVVVSTSRVCSELSPKLAAFWCSRPIPMGRWYWTKYFSGLAVTLAAGMLPLGLVVAVLALDQNSEGGLERVWEYPLPLLWLVGLAMIYSAGIAVSVLLRQTAYAVMVLIGLVVMAQTFLVFLCWIAAVVEVFPTVDWVPWAAVLAVLLCGVLAFVGRMALRRGWGRAGSMACG